MNTEAEPIRSVLGLIFPPTLLPPGLEFEVIPGHFLRHPTGDEAEACRNALREAGTERLLNPFLASFRRNAWGQLDTGEEDLLCVLHKRTAYGTALNDGFLAFETAVSLLDFEVHPTVPITIYHKYGFSFGNLPHSTLFLDVWAPSEAELAKVRRSHESIVSLDPKHIRIARALDLYSRVRRSEDWGIFRTVVLMTVVEALLTHSPSGRHDSISRQIMNNVPRVLRLASQSQSPLSCDSIEHAWKQLYKLRSIIAHGGSPDFSKKEVAGLQDFAQATKYLAESVRALLRQALVEPNLIEELAEC